MQQSYPYINHNYYDEGRNIKSEDKENKNTEAVQNIAIVSLVTVTLQRHYISTYCIKLKQRRQRKCCFYPSFCHHVASSSNGGYNTKQNFKPIIEKEGESSLPANWLRLLEIDKKREESEEL